MDDDEQRTEPDTPSTARMRRATARIASTRLLRGSRELVIEHEGDEYRLRLTSNNKLILTK